MTSTFSRHLVCSRHWDHTNLWQRHWWRCHRAASSRYSCYSVPCMPWAWARPCQKDSTTSSATSRCPGIPKSLARQPLLLHMASQLLPPPVLSLQPRMAQLALHSRPHDEALLLH
jgi:hypothetical protein